MDYTDLSSEDGEPSAEASLDKALELAESIGEKREFEGCANLAGQFIGATICIVFFVFALIGVVETIKSALNEPPPPSAFEALSRCEALLDKSISLTSFCANDLVLCHGNELLANELKRWPE